MQNYITWYILYTYTHIDVNGQIAAASGAVPMQNAQVHCEYRAWDQNGCSELCTKHFRCMFVG